MSDVTAIPTLIYGLIQQQHARNPDRPALIGVAGAQGSGKTTACKLLEMANRPRFAHFSMDDVYLTKAERQRMAREAHPLFATRGPPGTHDIDIAVATLIALKIASPDQDTRFTTFDKASDDRAPKSEWPSFRGRPEAILVDGWCLGALAPERSAPLNAVERIDNDGVWRDTQAAYLENSYADFFDRFDAIVYLKPPSWDIVRAWRGQQEEHMLGRALTEDENAKLDRFVMHYERITRSMMAGGHAPATVVSLNENRDVLRVAPPR